MRRHNLRGSVAKWLTMFALSAALPAALADTTTLLPLSPEQIGSSTAVFGGSGDCRTTGAYDAASLIWTQSGVCSDTGLSIGSSTDFKRLSTQANLAALVDNSGNLLGGAFTLFGTIPDLGLPSWSLLAAGRLLDVNYGPPASIESYTIGGAVSLIKLDYVADPLESFGSVLMWVPYANMTPWSTAPGGTAPWSVSATTAQNFTGTTYMFFDSSTFATPVPEPSTFALFGLGLLTLIAVHKRRRH